MKMCLSSLPGLIRALSRMSALFVEARTMTWSVVPIPEEECRRFEPALIYQWSGGGNKLLREVKLTVHLHQQLVQRLLLLGVREARHVVGALLSHGVNLIDVDDAGRSAPSLFEQTPHPGGTQS